MKYVHYKQSHSAGRNYKQLSRKGELFLHCYVRLAARTVGMVAKRAPSPARESVDR